MLNAEQVAADEEQLRGRVQLLSAEQKKYFYRAFEKQIKDPDTYAVLNYLLLAGLHHFYLGKWSRGFINLAVFLLGGLLLLVGSGVIGLLLLAVILVVELPALFQSQTIVADYNNKVMARLLSEMPRP